jgi:hypothetical protein
LGVFALPIGVTSFHMGALDLFRYRSGSFTPADLEGGLAAAALAALPVLDLMTAEVDWAAISQGETWSELTTLERVEVYQATGMIMGQLGLDATEALVRLRAHAYRNGMTASEVAWAIVERKLSLAADDEWRGQDPLERLS